MEIVDISRLKFPVFEFPKNRKYFHSSKSNQFSRINRLGIRNLKNDGLIILDSSGRMLELENFTRGRFVWPGFLELIGFNPKYEFKASFRLVEELSLEAFKEQITSILKKNRYTLESSGDPDEIMQQVEKAESYRDIIEMFL